MTVTRSMPMEARRPISGGAQEGAAGEDGGALADVLGAAADVGAGPGGRADADGVGGGVGLAGGAQAGFVGFLEGDDGVGAGGDGGAGHDADGLAGAEGAVEEVAGGELADHVEAAGGVGGGGGGVGGADGVAVHGGVVVGGMSKEPVTSWARVWPWAPAMGLLSGGRSSQRARMRWRAVSTESMSAGGSVERGMGRVLQGGPAGDQPRRMVRQVVVRLTPGTVWMAWVMQVPSLLRSSASSWAITS